MPGSLVIPNAVQIKIKWTYGTLQGINVLGGVGAGSASVNQALADNLDTMIKAALTSSGLVPLLHSTVTLNQVTVRSLVSAGLAEWAGAGAGVAGTGTGDRMPNSVASIVSLKTARAGKSYRGRVYISGFSEGQNDPSGQMVNTVATASTAFINTIRTNITGQGLQLAVLSPALPERTTKPGTVLPAKPAFAEPVTTQLVRSFIWGTQRKRNHRK